MERVMNYYYFFFCAGRGGGMNIYVMLAWRYVSRNIFMRRKIDNILDYDINEGEWRFQLGSCIKLNFGSGSNWRINRLQLKWKCRKRSWYDNLFLTAWKWKDKMRICRYIHTARKITDLGSEKKFIAYLPDFELGVGFLRAPWGILICSFQCALSGR
jgi:hypothetical protein